MSTQPEIKAPQKVLGSARLLLPADDHTGELRVVRNNEQISPTADVCVIVYPKGSRPTKRWATRWESYRTVGAHKLADGGMVVELHRAPNIRRIVDIVCDEAADGHDLRFSSNGDLVASYGPGHLLRISVDDSPNTWALRTLRDRPRTPRLVAWGQEAGAYWAIESRLAGRHPRRVSHHLALDLVAYCATLPRQEIPPIAPSEDVAEMRAHLPEHRDVWALAEERLDSGVVEWSVARHGDLRRGNVLATRGRLSGIVGWDHWHAFSVPGADLLNLFAPRAGSDIGRRFATRPWTSQSFHKLTQVYWGSFRLDMTDAVLEAAAVAWWVGQLAIAARSTPSVVSNPRWIADNVDAVAAMLAS